MKKCEMLDAICDFGYYPYNSEFDSYKDILEEYRYVMEEARRGSKEKVTRDLFRRD